MKINKLERTVYRVNGCNFPMFLYSTPDWPGLVVRLISAPPNPREMIVSNYETCIQGKLILPEDVDEGSVDEQAAWVLKGGHTPALESVHITFGIEGASVVLLKQISRHRIGNSLGVMTQRANAEEWLGRMYDNHHFVTPKSIAQNATVNSKYESLVAHSQAFYKMAIEHGIQQDEARYGIIQGATTLWQGTYAYKTLLDNICSTRMCHVMQGEMVALANLMAAAVIDYDELLGGALKPVCLRYGKCNRNENNPTETYPKGVCSLTQDGVVPVREADKTHDLTQYSKDAHK